MKQIGTALAGALIAGCLGIATADAQNAQLISDLLARHIKVDYYAPRDAVYQTYYQTLQQRDVLERLGQFLAPVNWPHTVRLLAKECPASVPRPQVFYDRLEYSLTICYQAIDDLKQAAATAQPGKPNASLATPQQVLVGGLVGSVLHAAARASFDMLDVPVFGSDEDASDQLSAFAALQFGDNVAHTVITGTYVMWKYYESKGDAGDYASASGTVRQRADNILCIAFGGRPAAFKGLITKGLLPVGRASDCTNEYNRAHDAFLTTIKPNVNLAMMNKVLSMTWITPDDLK